MKPSGAAAAGVGSVLPPAGVAGVSAAGAGRIATPSGGTGGIATTPTAGTGTGITSPASGSGGSMITGAGGMAAAGGAAASGGSTAGTGGGAAPVAGAGGGGGPVGAPGSCGPESTISAENLGDPKMLGPWMPTMKAATGPTGASTLFYPMDLGKGGVLHPVFHWGCGAGSQPSQYADHLNLLASYGIVVIANASGSMPAKASLDWMAAENDKMGSMFYKKLDTTRMGIGGHSLGALETMGSASDPRIGLYVLVCGGCMSGKGGCGAANIHAPSIFLGGEGESGTMNFEGDYAEVTKASSIFITKTSTDHIYCARNNLAPWVAFMRWNFCGEDKWKKEFAPDGTYCKAPWLACKTKGL
jgi:hypothetical protein